MNNAITTPDGYFYTQQPSGWYTDGDMTFNYDMSDDMRGVVWQNMDGHYCADGDGLVVVAHDGAAWIVTDQGDPISAFDTLRDALFAAQAILAADYPAVYETYIF